MLLTLALGSLSLLPLAQASPPPQAQPARSTQLRRATPPRYAGIYLPGLGLTPPNQTHRSASAPVTLYNNAQLSNYYSFPGARQEWIDEGSLIPRHSQDGEQVLGAQLTYCTRAIRPGGLRADFRIYEQSAPCAGPNSWPASSCSYTLVGLPASPNGNDACYTIDLDLRGFECDLDTPGAPHTFGWSVVWDADDTGLYTAWGGPGNSDTFVWYDIDRGSRNAAYMGCYWFGGKPRAGFALQLFGGPPETFAQRASNPGSADSLTLTAETQLTNDQLSVLHLRDRISHDQVDGVLWISRARVERSLLSTGFGLDARELAAFPARLRPPNLISSQRGAFRVTPRGLPPGNWYSQAAQLDGFGQPIALSNAILHRVD